MYTVYGIKNCDTVKKALSWLEKHKIAYTFHDYKSKGITEPVLKNWSAQVGWESLVNKRGLTWKQLPEATQKAITNESAALGLMIDKTSVIKRPLIEKDGKVVTLGFVESDFADKFTK